MSNHLNHPGTLESIENKIYDIFSHATDQRCRNLFIRFDLNFPDDCCDYQEPALFSEFMRVFIQDLNRKECGDAYYLAVREKDSSLHGHYHVFLLLNGKITQNIYGHMDRAQELWSRTLNRYASYNGSSAGLVHYRSPDQGNGVMLRTDDPDYHAKTMNCIAQSLYLAKAATKDSFGKYHHTWASSKGIPSRFEGSSF